MQVLGESRKRVSQITWVLKNPIFGGITFPHPLSKIKAQSAGWCQMLFKSSADTSFEEYNERRSRSDDCLSFGVDFLDDALRGILPDDLILLGAPSGAGKTQLCCNIALANMQAGKKVFYVALEASRFEIERRLKFPLVADLYFSDDQRPQLSKRLTYPSWLAGDFKNDLHSYETKAAEMFEQMGKDLFLFYKQDKFGCGELVDAVLSCSDRADLIMIDHVHYFDFDDDNENRAIKDIAKTVRTLALEEQKPIILVAHLRKRDRANDELVAGLEEFHGSSDLYKIATKVVTIGQGSRTESGLFETFFRIPKNRIDGGVTRFLGRELFNPKKGTYEQGKYQIGWADQKRSIGFKEVDGSQYPEWGRIRGSVLSANTQRKALDKIGSTRAQALQRMPYRDSGDEE